MQTQYEWIQGSRGVLLDYCRAVSEENFTKEHSSFGRGGSMRNLLVHVANTYQFWIGEHGLKKQMHYPKYDECKNVYDVIVLFHSIDDLVTEFLEKYNGNMMQEIEHTLSNSIGTAPAFRLFTHVITHEFHHKGQILSISRLLGYIPVDTDIMR